MNSNQKANQIAIKKYRKEIEAMIGEICEVDIRVLNKALNVGLRDVKQLTPVGVYKDRTGGTLRREWHIIKAKKLGSTVQGHLYNNTEYAQYVNYGHRVVNRSRETIGWVTGRFMLEKATYRIDKTIEEEFRKEIERVNRKYDK